jgi:hypothetical protein
MQTNQVTTVADDNGKVIRQSENPEYGYVRVIQKAVEFSSRGWVNKKDRSALIQGKMEDLKDLGLDKVQTLVGRICVKESTNTFNESNPDRSLKVAGSTGVICCTSDGEPIHRITFYDASGLQVDELVAHANGNAIREANANADGAKKIAKSEFKTTPAPKKEKIESSDEIEEVVDEIEIEEVKEDSFEL